MIIAVFGATGGTGKQVVQQALEQGHTVRALVRAPRKLALNHENLHVVEGNVLEQESVETTLAGAGAVVCSLGHSDNNPPDVVSAGTANIIAGMQALAIKRLVVVTSLGVGDSIDQVPFFFKTLMKTVLRQAMADKEVQEQLVRESGLDWIIVRPGGLTDEPFTGQYHAGTDKSIGAGSVSRANVAHFVLRQVQEDQYLRQTPAIS